MAVEQGPPSLLAAAELVRVAASGKSDHAAFARRLLPLLEEALEAVAGSVVTRPLRRGTGVVEYVVEKTQQGEVLTENRPGRRSKPFRCPKSVYEALIRVLGGADRPLTTDEITSGVERLMETRPPDHQVRVALRLMLHVEPALLSRSRARYRPVDPRQFPKSADALWFSLRG